MADNIRRYGFRWHKGQFACVPKGEFYHVADGYQGQSDAPATNVDINIGDPVAPAAGGGVILANTTVPVFGIVIGVHRIFEPATGVTRPADRVPGGTTGGGNIDRLTMVEVVPAKGIIWEIDMNGIPAGFTKEMDYRNLINRNVEHVLPGDFTVAGRPKADPMLSATTGTGAGLGWRIVGVSETVHNKDFTGNFVKLLVKVNDSTEAGSAATTVAGV